MGFFFEILEFGDLALGGHSMDGTENKLRQGEGRFRYDVSFVFLWFRGSPKVSRRGDGLGFHEFANIGESRIFSRLIYMYRGLFLRDKSTPTPRPGRPGGKGGRKRGTA